MTRAQEAFGFSQITLLSYHKSMYFSVFGVDFAPQLTWFFLSIGSVCLDGGSAWILP